MESQKGAAMEAGRQKNRAISSYRYPLDMICINTIRTLSMDAA